MEQLTFDIRAKGATHGDGAGLSPQLCRQIIEASAAPIIVFACGNRDPSIRFVNRAFSKRTGYAVDEIRHADWWALHEGRDNERALADLREAMRRGSELQIELRSHSKTDDSWFWSHLNMAPLIDEGGTQQYYVGVLRDISDERDQLDELAHNAFHDALTGLPNRRLLIDHFGQAVDHARRDGHEFALALVDLNDFKLVNDTFGHRAGDDLLRTVGTRLTRELRAEDTVARLGGDEFAVLIQPTHGDASEQAIDARLKSIIERPMMIQGHRLSASCSIGVSLCPMQGLQFESLLDQADRRMYAQKIGNRLNRRLDARKIDLYAGDSGMSLQS